MAVAIRCITIPWSEHAVRFPVEHMVNDLVVDASEPLLPRREEVLTSDPTPLPPNCQVSSYGGRVWTAVTSS